MDQHRFNRWKRASLLFMQVEPFLSTTVQALGKLDADLFEKDERYREIRDRSHVTPAEWEQVKDSVTLAYLWVLGAYEVVRTMDQRFRDLGMHAMGQFTGSTALKRKFNRVRVPLAKLEAASAHKDSDKHFAYPALTSSHGIGWHVADGVVISRGELSTSLLEFFEESRPDWGLAPTQK